MVNEKFTGKERDQETGLDFFGARYMSAAQGRFTSPDPVDHPSKSSLGYDAFLAEPQRWNLYAYAVNNPLRYIDQNGAEAGSIYLGGNRYLAGGQIITVPRRSFLEQLAIAAAPAIAMAAAVLAPEAGLAGLARYSPLIYNALTRFSNSQTGQQLTQTAAETITGVPLGNSAASTFGFTSVEGTLEGFTYGRLANGAEVAAQFTKSGGNLTASILAAFNPDNVQAAGTRQAILSGSQAVAKEQGATSLTIRAVGVINSRLAELLLKRGFRETTIRVGNEMVKAFEITYEKF